MADHTAPDHDGTTRRTLMRTATWTAPVLAVAAAAPAFATSTRNDISNRRFKLTSDSSQVQVTDISVTNDGPSTLAARTVRLSISSMGGDSLVQRSGTGSWIPDPAFGDLGTQLFWLYDATIAVGESVPLVGSVRAVVDADAGLNFNVTISYFGPV